MNVAVHISDDDKRKKTLEDLQGLFNSNEIFSAKVTPVNIDAAKVANIKTPAKLEQEILKQNPVKPGDLIIIEWANQKEDIYVSTDRAIFISERVGEFKYFSQFSSAQNLSSPQLPKSSIKSSDRGSFVTTRFAPFSAL